MAEDRIVSRDCPATAIPSGESYTIPKGATVQITHRLGGNFTVLWAMGMARITGEQADAIGEEAVVSNSNELSSQTEECSGPPDENALWDALKSVYDPEIPVNIVDLGLIYSLQVQPQNESGNHDVEILMTLTAPGCGMGPAIAADAESRVCQIPGVGEAQVELVWDPPWNQDMISEEGKMQLGLI